MGSISSLSSSSLLQSILQSVLQKATSSSTTSTSQSDSSQLSPLANILGELQNLQQTNPTQYQQVTQQIATNLQSAAKTDTSNGNTAGANQLNQLATDFTNASASGQLPNLQDLAQAIGGAGSGGHHHHHHSDSSSDSSSSSTASTSQSQALLQLISAYQSNSTSSQSNSTNPLTIIQNTLAAAGITSSS
jgi:G3E family GTPase